MRHKRQAIPDGWKIVFNPPPQRKTKPMVTVTVYGHDMPECGPPREILLSHCTRPYNEYTIFEFCERVKAGMKTIWPDWCPPQEPKIHIRIWEKEVE